MPRGGQGIHRCPATLFGRRTARLQRDLHCLREAGELPHEHVALRLGRMLVALHGLELRDERLGDSEYTS